MVMTFDVSQRKDLEWEARFDGTLGAAKDLEWEPPFDVILSAAKDLGGGWWLRENW
jgi:hypothetical protein